MYLQKQISRVFDYPKHYMSKCTITIIPKEQSQISNLIFEKTVLEIGQIPRIMFHPVTAILRLQRTPKKVSRRFPPAADLRPPGLL